jgi:protein-disulfide isomerase
MLLDVASRKQQKEQARAAREAAHAQLRSQQNRRSRVLTLGGVLAVVIAAVVVVIIVSSSGGGGSSGGVLTQRDSAGFTHSGAQADVKTLLSGIPQSGNVLGSPIAPVTITEFGDLVCSTCDAFALESEPQLIQSEVRTGKVQLVYRGDDTASATANGKEWAATQLAARSAGLQNKEWNFIMTVYDEQPLEIDGKSAELATYVTPAYLANRAQQVAGLNMAKWQANLTNPSLKAAVAADLHAAQDEAPNGTPTIIVEGPKGSVTYDSSDTLSAVPTLAQLQALIKQVT